MRSFSELRADLPGTSGSAKTTVSLAITRGRGFTRRGEDTAVTQAGDSASGPRGRARLFGEGSVPSLAGPGSPRGLGRAGRCQDDLRHYRIAQLPVSHECRLVMDRGSPRPQAHRGERPGWASGAR